MARQRKHTETEAEPIGQAEAQRLEGKAKAAERIERSKDTLAAAKAKLAEAKEQFRDLGPQAGGLLAAPRAEIEHAELVLEHAQAALALLESKDVLDLVNEWDEVCGSETASHAGQFVENIQPDVVTVRAAAKALVASIVTMREKFDATSLAAVEAERLARSLAQYGIRVRVVRPSLVKVQSAVALALRAELQAAGFTPNEHFVKECLSPRNYDDRTVSSALPRPMSTVQVPKAAE